MRKATLLMPLAVLLLGFAMCRKAEPFDESGYDERLSGGAATVFDETSKAFSHGMDGLNARDLVVHDFGDKSFEQTFVAAPAPFNSGLGPVFNNVSCISCHHNDGKGTPTAGTVTSSLLFRMSVPGVTEHGGPVGVPGYGNQLQDLAIFGRTPEAKIDIAYTEEPFTYADGSKAALRRPVYTARAFYTAVAAHALSPRMAPPVFGLGLLEAIPATTLEAFADEGDADGDGISGRPNYVWNPATGRTEIGRFGLKANNPSLLVQVAGAYNQDMGITTPLFPQESAAGQLQADDKDDDPELPDSTLRAVTFYVRTLAVPARRDVRDATVLRGEQLFRQLNCGGCHKPTVQTGADMTLPAVSNQRIHPYTDLLLHDLGADLADGYADYRATGNEWRTAPLWGIGLFEKTNGIPYYLHDGRARTLEEAILWHGGEAARSKAAFTALSRAERQAVIRFLKSL